MNHPEKITLRAALANQQSRRNPWTAEDEARNAAKSAAEQSRTPDATQDDEDTDQDEDTAE